MAMTKISGFIGSKNGITLFFADGNSQVLQHNEWRTQEILDQIIPALSKNGGSHAEIELERFSIEQRVAQATNGAVKIKEQADGGFAISTDKIHIADGKAIGHLVDSAVYGGGGPALKRFLEKFAGIKRKHNADELLTFMNVGKLPIAADGSIIGFKILDGSHGLEDMRDPHTGKISQQVGSLVYMPASKVDDNRRVACSTGLHICSHGYISGFWHGTKRCLTLVKIQPGDVICVPLNETSKMRVSAYHICAVFLDEDAQKIANGSRVEDVPSAAALLSDVIAGNHPSILERVEVTGKGDFKVEKIEKVRETTRKRRRHVPLVKPRTDLKSIKKAVKVAKAKAGSPDPAYRKKLTKAQAYYDQNKSIRWIAVKLGMDRESLGKNLVR